MKLTSGEKTTAPIALEVVAGQHPPAARGAAQPVRRPVRREPIRSTRSGAAAPAPEPKLAVDRHASRSRAHVGEPILVTYYLYTQATVSNVQLTAAPQYPGFWAEDPEQPNANPQGERTTLDGESYARFPILRKLLFPTRAGSLTIPPATFRIELSPRLVLRRRPQQRGRAPRRPLTLTADPLPTDPDFSGAVGDFRVSAGLDRTIVALGEAATLRFKVEGNGNLKWVERGPELQVHGARGLPAAGEERPQGGRGRDRRAPRPGSSSIVPETGGALTIPALPFSYFSPSAKAPRRVQTTPLTLEVQGTAAAAATVDTARATARGARERTWPCAATWTCPAAPCPPWARAGCWPAWPSRSCCTA